MVYLLPMKVPLTPVGNVPESEAPVAFPPIVYSISVIALFIQIVDVEVPPVRLIVPLSSTVIVPLNEGLIQGDPVVLTV